MEKVESTHEMGDATVLNLLQKLANNEGDRPAFVFVDTDLNQRVITRQEIWDISRKFAAVLKRLGLGKGDIICNTLVNSPERLLIFYGTLASGAIPCQGQLLRADGEDLIRILKESKSKAIIYDPKVLNGAKRILEKIKFTDETSGMTRYKDLPNLTHVIEIEAEGLEEAERWMHVIDKEEEMFVDESVSKDDVAMIFITSGTTGFSKLVPHRHSKLLSALSGAKYFAKCSEDVYFNMQPFGWLGGFPGFYLIYGCQRVAIDLTNGLPEKIPMGVFLIKVLNQTKVTTATFKLPDLHSVVDATNDGYQLERQLNILFTGGGPIHNAAMEALGKITQRVGIAYAGTEFLIVSTIVAEKKSDFEDMCTGLVENAEVKIVGEYEEELPVEKHGEILIRSETVFTGYLNNPEKTAEAFTKDGWYRSGDIGYFNKEGRLFVLCRKADVIIKDGLNYYPGWIEGLINKHPRVQSSLVIGISDPVHHEEICLCLKLMPDSDVSVNDMREYCKTLFINGENDLIVPLPKYYLIFDEFISNDNGKVDRKKMKEEASKRIDSDQ